MSQLLTSEMIRALKLLKENGVLVWYRGGCWHKPEAEMIQQYGSFYPKDAIRTSTLKALETRNMIRFLHAPGDMAPKYIARVIIDPDALLYSANEVKEIVLAVQSGRLIPYPNETPLLPC